MVLSLIHKAAKHVPQTIGYKCYIKYKKLITFGCNNCVESINEFFHVFKNDSFHAGHFLVYCVNSNIDISYDIYIVLRDKACELPSCAFRVAMAVQNSKFWSQSELIYYQTHACKEGEYAYQFSLNIINSDFEYCKRKAIEYDPIYDYLYSNPQADIGDLI